MQNKLGYKIYKNAINNKSSRKLFNSFLKVLKFCDKGKNFKSFSEIKNWQSPELHKKLINLRKKNKHHFALIYDVMQKNNSINEFCMSNKLDLIAKKFLGIKEGEMMMRSQIRMDVPKDTRNTFGWHQDSAYDKLNLNPKNGVVLWIPLLNAQVDKGALEVKPRSQSEKNTYIVKKKYKKFQSPQLIVPDKALAKYETLKVPVKKEQCLALYGNVFHKSGNNFSDKIRFTIIARFNKILTKDFYIYNKTKTFDELY
ncbi:MAG: phytanoyl-CoA dioxygenase family protein [Pelagibacteraceae bacterium]